MPTEVQRRPVLSIDLGASYTKLAWRPEWMKGVQVFKRPSVALRVDGEVLIPSIAFEGGDGRWFFGQVAAGMTPATDGRLHKNWKAVLFNPKASKRELKIALEVAEKFLAWLRSELAKERVAVNKGVTRLCVPAFEESNVGCQRLLEAMRRAGWSENEAILRETEPKANIVGLASKGKNYAFNDHGRPDVDLGETYRNGLSLVGIARNTINGAPHRRFCTIDIGAFTTDVSVCDVGSGVELVEQLSYVHGIASLDAHVERLMLERGADPTEIRPADFEQLKRFIYEGRDCQLSIGTRTMEFEGGCMEGEMVRFADEIVRLVRSHSGVHNLILTGGGSCIPTIARRIEQGLSYFVVKPGFEEESGERAATALGGASVVVDFYHPDEKGPSIARRETWPGGCSCGGWNKNCMRCGGTGIGEREKGQDGRMVPKSDAIPTDGGETERRPVAERPEELKRPTEPVPPPVQEPARPPSPRINPGDILDPIAPPLPRPRPPSKDVSAEDIVQCWRGKEKEALAKFCLDGWMGRLIFDGNLSAEQKRQRLLTADSREGRAAWCKLLCLCTSLGVRSHPSVVQTFWENQLQEVWEALIPRHGNLETSTALDEFFEAKIHQQFGDLNASGEDAELWRRVFYDFRKLHWFVYKNQLQEAFLEFLGEPGLRFDALVNFLKAGKVPGGKRWAGVLGQSMSAPLLLLLRMLRRLRVIDRPDFDAACFYMNGPVRRVAVRLGWVEDGERLWYDMESLVELSRKCHKKMRECLPKDMWEYYDIPLQWYADRNRKELRLQ